jgi:hypothetical protein
MGALAVERARRARTTDRPRRDRDDQPRLFAIPGGAEASPLVTRPVPLRAVPPETYAAQAAAVAAPAPAHAPAAQAITVTRSLDSALLAAWAGLTAGHPVACPVCDGMMVARPAASEGCAGGRCTSCGTTLD